MEEPEPIAATEPEARKIFSKLLHSIEVKDKKCALISLILIWRGPSAIRNLFPDDEANSPPREIAIQQWILSLLPELCRLMLLDNSTVSLKFQAAEWMALLINTECLRHLLFPPLVQIILLKIPSAFVPTPSNWNTIIPHVYYVAEPQKSSQEEGELPERQSNLYHRQAIFVMNYFSHTTASTFHSSSSSKLESESSELKSCKSIYWEGSDPILICCFVLKGVLSFLSSTLSHSTAVSTHHVNNVLYWDGFIKQYFMRGTLEGTDHDDALCGSGYESLSQISEALWKEGGIMHALLLAVVVYSKRITASSTTEDKLQLSTNQLSSSHSAGQEQEQISTATRHLSCQGSYDDALRGLRTTVSRNGASGYHINDENNHVVDRDDDFGTDWDNITKNNEDKVESLRALQSIVDLLQLWVNDDTDTAWKLQHFLQINGVRVHINAYQRDGGVPGEEGETLDVTATLIDLFPLLKGKLMMDDDDVEIAAQQEDNNDDDGGNGQIVEEGDKEEGIDDVIGKSGGRYSRFIAANTLLTTLQTIVTPERQLQPPNGKVFSPQKGGIEALRYALEKAQQQQQRAADVKMSVMHSPSGITSKHRRTLRVSTTPTTSTTQYRTPRPPTSVTRNQKTNNTPSQLHHPGGHTDMGPPPPSPEKGGNDYYYYVSDHSRKQISKATAAAKDYYFTNRTVLVPTIPLIINNNKSTTMTTSQPLVYNTPRSSAHPVDSHKEKNVVTGSTVDTTAMSTAARQQSQQPQHQHQHHSHLHTQNKQYPDLSRRKGLVLVKQQSTEESWSKKSKPVTVTAVSPKKDNTTHAPLDLSTLSDPFPQPPEGISILQTGFGYKVGMTAYLKKMGISLNNVGGVGGSVINDIGDGGTGVGVETGEGVDTMVELSGNTDLGHDGLESLSGPESGSATVLNEALFDNVIGKQIVTPLTDEEFLMVLNEAKLEHAKHIKKAVQIHEREKMTTVPPAQSSHKMSPTSLSSSSSYSPLATKHPKNPCGMMGNIPKGDKHSIPLAFGGNVHVRNPRLDSTVDPRFPFPITREPPNYPYYAIRPSVLITGKRWSKRRLLNTTTKDSAKVTQEIESGKERIEEVEKK